MIYGDLDYKLEEKDYEFGNFQNPIVLEGIPFESEWYTEEYFGPVFCLYKVTSV